jgi:hypothetical protein
MASANDFRRIALGLEHATEGAHMGHPDFRVHGRIFATIHPDHRTGMVKLTPDEQRALVREHPTVFSPENGAWGRQGCTRVQLANTDEETIGEAMTLAWRGVHAKQPVAPRATPARTSRLTATSKARNA